MKLNSKLIYQARRHGLDITKMNNGEVKLMNLTTKRYIHVLPNGRICSEDILGQDRALKCLMSSFLKGEFLALPCTVTLHVGNGALMNDLIFAKQCLEQYFANMKNFKMVEDDDLLPTECRIEHDYALSYKRRQAFIDACLEYLN